MPKQTVAEQILAFETKRQALVGRMTDIMEKSTEDGSTLDATQSQEYDALEGEVKAVDEHIARLKRHEAAIVSKAVAVTVGKVDDPQAASQLREHSGIISVKANLEPGQKFARYALALARAKGNLAEAHNIVQGNKGWMDTSPELLTVMKTAIAAGDTTTSGWASQLVYANNLANEFIEYLRPMTILGRIPGLRRVPFNVRMGSQTASGSANWIGQAKPIPVSKLTTGSTSLAITKVAALMAIDEELIRSSSPSAELLVRDDLAKTTATFIDTSFIDPNQGGSTNVQPASVTYGVTPTTPSGTNAAAVRADVQAVFSAMIAANVDFSQACWVMSATIALALSMMKNSLGQFEYPTLTINGGTWMGLPVIVSQSAYITGSPDYGNMIVLINGPDIFLADDGQVTIDISNEASIEMSDVPTNSAQAGGVTATTMVSMFQVASSAVRALRFINWTKRRTTAVAFIRTAAYTG